MCKGALSRAPGGILCASDFSFMTQGAESLYQCQVKPNLAHAEKHVINVNVSLSSN